MLKASELYYLQYLMMFPAEWRSPMSDNRVSEDIDCEYANSMSSELFIITKDGVNYLATYVAPGDGAYDSAAGSTDSSSESKGSPDTGFACVAAPILAGGVLTAALTRKRR